MTEDINAALARVREWYWLPDQDRADRDTLLAHIDTLTRERDEARAHAEEMRVQWDRGIAENADLRAGVERLKEALTPFACSCVPGVCGQDNEHSPGVVCHARQARKLVGPYEGMPTGALAKGGRS